MTSEKIRIIHMDDDMVVVNKPASIPVRFQMYFSLKVRFDSKFEFLEIMKLKSMNRLRCGIGVEWGT